MSHFYQDKILNYSAEKLYQIIIDVESYPEFLPWCKFAKITKYIDINQFEADLTVNFKAVMQKYTSLVVGDFDADKKNFTVTAKAISGPFRKLETKWHIIAIDSDVSNVSCEINFEFSSRLIDKMLSSVFTIASQKMISAFEERAKNLFG